MRDFIHSKTYSIYEHYPCNTIYRKKLQNTIDFEISQIFFAFYFQYGKYFTKCKHKYFLNLHRFVIVKFSLCRSLLQ